MHEIPETMAQVADLVATAEANGQPTTTDEVIAAGLQNWLQSLLDEGIEGGYDTARLTNTGLSVTDISGQVIYHAATPTLTELIPAFKADPHMTMLKLQTLMRQLFSTGQLQ